MDHSLANHSVLAGQPLVGQRLASQAASEATRTVTITKPDGSESQLAIEDTRAGQRSRGHSARLSTAASIGPAWTMVASGNRM